MKFIWILIFTHSFSAFGNDELVPQSVEISGKFQFSYTDNDGKFYISNVLESVPEMQGASTCTLEIIAGDNFYNTYPGYFNLMKVEEAVLPYFIIESLYITENGLYRKIPIDSASFEIVDQVADEKNWKKDTLEGSLALTDTEMQHGLKMFHELTMGQPMTMTLKRPIAPKEIIVNMKPLTAKISSFVRRCMKLIHNDT